MKKQAENLVSGVGIDIEEVARFRKLPFQKHSSFYKKIFTQAEIDYCLSCKDPYPHFTARFCAKEALLKAVYPALKNPFQAEIIIKEGRPCFKAPFLKREVQLSLSHTENMAAAVVFVSSKEKKRA